VNGARDRKHAEAYREMEVHLCDCLRMAQITAGLMSDTDDGTDPKLVFAVFHLVEMIEGLQERYMTDFDANASKVEEPSTGRT